MTNTLKVGLWTSFSNFDFVVVSGAGTMSDSISDPFSIDISLFIVAIVVGFEELLEIEKSILLLLNAFGSTTDADVKDV